MKQLEQNRAVIAELKEGDLILITYRVNSSSSQRSIDVRQPYHFKRFEKKVDREVVVVYPAQVVDTSSQWMPQTSFRAAYDEHFFGIEDSLIQRLQQV